MLLALVVTALVLVVGGIALFPLRGNRPQPPIVQPGLGTRERAPITLEDLRRAQNSEQPGSAKEKIRRAREEAEARKKAREAAAAAEEAQRKREADAATSATLAGRGKPGELALGELSMSDSSVTGVVTGRVVGPDGAPVAGATVSLDTARATLKATTREDGTYAILEVPFPVHAEVQAFPPSGVTFVPSEIVLVETPEATGETTKIEFAMTQDLQLREGSTLYGIVVTKQNAPIAGATITWNTGYSSGTMDSGADGRFEIPGLEANRRIEWIDVRHKDFIPARRTDLTGLESEIRFVLDGARGITLAVKWESDGSPVTSYAYTLNRQGWNEFEFRSGLESAQVESDTGETPLSQLESGKWRAEVTVIGSDGKPTDIRDSAAFTLDASSPGHQTIEVKVKGGRTLKGKVVSAKDGSALGFSKVEILPPSDDPNAFNWRGAPSSRYPRIPAVETGMDGAFTFEGLAPGPYIIAASHQNFVMVNALDFRVVAEKDPDPLTIVLSGGGRLFGKVTGGGMGLAGVTISVTSSGVNWGWEKSVPDAVTDSAGEYSIADLRPGAHYVRVQLPSGLETRLIDISAGEERQLDFDADAVVKVFGTVYVGDAPAARGNLRIAVVKDPGGSARDLMMNSGTYETDLTPGRYTAVVYSGNTITELETFEIGYPPAELQKDFHIDFGEADVLIAFPDGVQFELGIINLAKRERHFRYQLSRTSVWESVRHLTQIPAGEYQVTFESSDQQWQGHSEWLAVTPGQTTTFLVEARRLQQLTRIGGWTPSEASITEKELRWDVSAQVTAGGTYMVLFAYERGRHALAITSVKLLENGRVIASDTHDGWSGVDKVNTLYALPVRQAAEGATYTVVARTRADGGTDSAGSVYLRTE